MRPSLPRLCLIAALLAVVIPTDMSSEGLLDLVIKLRPDLKGKNLIDIVTSHAVHLIVVTKKEKKIPANIYYDLEVFTPNQMDVYPLNHIYQPVFTLYRKNDPEYPKLGKKSTLTQTEITDRVARWFDARTDDIFMVVRHGSEVEYRRVTGRFQ